MTRASVLSVFLLASTAASEVPLTIPPDRSLGSAEYVEQGMPDPTVDWGAAEAREAWAVLQKLYGEDPAKLPRYRSGRSGPLFDKLLSESFTVEATVGDMTMSEFEAAIDSDLDLLSHRSLMSVYWLRPEVGLFFDRELVEIVAHALNETAAM